jgi:hypothetical protein
MPTLLLLIATFSSLFSGIVLRNHSKLVECALRPVQVNGNETDGPAVGSLFLPSMLSTSRLAKNFEILRNPFTITAAGGSAAILIGSLVVPP